MTALTTCPSTSMFLDFLLIQYLGKNMHESPKLLDDPLEMAIFAEKKCYVPLKTTSASALPVMPIDD